MGRARDVLLSSQQSHSLLLRTFIIHDRCVAWAMRICYGNTAHHHHGNPHQNGGVVATATNPPRRSRGEAGVLVRESTCTTQTYKTTRAILGNFYSYNDFLCNSVNKWLYQFIPVR